MSVACSVRRLSPQEYLKASNENNRLQMQYEIAQDARKGSFAGRFLGFWRREMDPNLEGLSKMDFMQRSIRSSVGNLLAGPGPQQQDAKQLRSAASAATRSIYGALLSALLSVVGATLFGLTISWNTIPIEIYGGMRTTLMVLTVLFQISFAIPVLFIWDGSNFFSLVDFAMCLISIPGNYHWSREYKKHGVLDGVDITSYCILIGYMFVRLWVRAVCRGRSQWKYGSDGGGMMMKRLEVVWVARSASLIAEIIPEINALWDSMVNKWGLEDTLKVCRFNIYCTDKESEAVDQLPSDLSEMSLYRQEFVHFGRPEFDQIIEDQTLEVIDESRTSNTLLAFCGSPQLAETIHRYQVSNFMLAAVTGHKKHQMHFVSERYGGVRKAKKKQRHQLQQEQQEQQQVDEITVSGLTMMKKEEEGVKSQKDSIKYG